MIFRLRELIPPADVSTQTPEGLWVAAHPLPYFGTMQSRWRAARAVWRGEAYAIAPPHPGEFEMALVEQGWQIAERKRSA